MTHVLETTLTLRMLSTGQGRRINKLGEGRGEKLHGIRQYGGSRILADFGKCRESGFNC